MCRVLRHVFLCLLCISSIGAIGSTQSANNENTDQVANIGKAKVTSGPPSLVSAIGFISGGNVTGTCPNRTINYITHTLARQCLRTGRAAYSSSNRPHGEANEGRAGASEVSATSPPSPAFTETVVVTSIVEAKTAVGNTTNHVSEANAQSSTAATDPSPAAEASSVSTPDEESDSPLDNANFLSFEEWKKQNLAKSGQSPEDVGHTQQVPVHRPRPINNALDTMGDEQEIDIDFSGFGNPAQPSQSDQSSSAASNAAHSTSGAADSGSLRSKDAGKTCKERTNYASFDCAATILKSNKECKHASSVLVENKDSYMLNKCSASNKFFIVELCNDIQIDTIVLANYEFFSSGFRHFRVSVSDRYPVKMEKWKTLGTFEARNTREIQAFLVENPQIWARYLRIEFLTQYGTEYYCPVSLLRVHGVTMMEDYRHQEELARGEVEDVSLEAEAEATPVVRQEPAESTDETLKATAQAIPSIEVEPSGQSQAPTAEPSPKSNTETTSPAASTTDAEETVVVYSNGSVPMQVGIYEPINVGMTCNNTLEPVDTATMTSQGSVIPRTAANSTSTTGSAHEQSSTADMTAIGSMNTTTSTVLGMESPSSLQMTDNSTEASSIVNNATISSSTTTATVAPSNSTTEQPSLSSNSTRSTVSSANSPPPPQPSTQESFFKSVTKRLAQLESNSTLSLQYISEQSLLLREAFNKVEKRQISKTTDFLFQLNQTVMKELYSLRQNYEELWQSTVLELEVRGEAHAREMLEVGKRLNFVADELVWQKRVGILQSTLILICLALILFERYGNGNGGAEMPLLEQILSRSSAALRKGWESPPDSPRVESHSRSPVSLFRRKIWRASTEPADVKLPGGSGGGAGAASSEEAHSRDQEVSNTAAENENPRRSVLENVGSEEERHSRASMESERPVSRGGEVVQGSPGKKRKKMKKSSGWLGRSSQQQQQQQQQQRTKSPLAMGGIG